MVSVATAIGTKFAVTESKLSRPLHRPSRNVPAKVTVALDFGPSALIAMTAPTAQANAPQTDQPYAKDSQLGCAMTISPPITSIPTHAISIMTAYLGMSRDMNI